MANNRDERKMKWQVDFDGFFNVFSTFVIDGNIDDIQPTIDADGNVSYVRIGDYFINTLYEMRDNDKKCVVIYDPTESDDKRFTIASPFVETVKENEEGSEDPDKLEYDRTYEDKLAQHFWEILHEESIEEQMIGHNAGGPSLDMARIHYAVTENGRMTENELISKFKSFWDLINTEGGAQTTGYVFVIKMMSRLLTREGSSNGLGADELLLFRQLLNISQNIVKNSEHKLIILANKSTDLPMWFSVDYNNYNYLKLVYQKYSAGNWGTPTVITTDVNNETNFEICTDENGIHIIYTRVNAVINEDNAKDYAKMLEVYTITYSNGSFSESIRISSTDAYKSNLNISSFDGKLYAAWTENSDYNILGMSGNYTVDEDGIPVADATNKNAVVIAVFRNNEWTSKSVTELGLIADIEFVKDNLVVILDKDCDVATATDRMFNYISASDDSATLINMDFTTDSTEVVVKEDTENEEVILSDYYNIVSVRYENGMLYLRTTSALCSVELVDGKIKAVPVINSLATDYKFVYDATGKLYGIIYVLNASDTSSNIYIRVYQDGVFTDEILLMENKENGIIDYYTYYILNGEVVIYYKNMKTPEDAQYGDAGDMSDTIDAIYSFAEMRLSDKGVDLALKNVYTKADNVAPEKAFDLTVTLHNNSLVTVNGVTVKVMIGENIIQTLELADVSIPAGAVTTHSFALTLKETEISEKYAIIVEPMSFTDEDTSNNRKNDVCLATPDLSIDAKYVVVGDIKYLLVIVQNNGAIPVNDFTLFVNNGVAESYDENQEFLYKLSMGDDYKTTSVPALMPGAFKHYTVELNKVYFTDDFVTLLVVAGENTLPEFNTKNNVMAYSMEENEPVSFGKQYSLNYYVDNVLVYSAIYKAGATIDVSAVDVFESKEGYTFSGWSGERDMMPSHDLNVYGYFKVNKYSVNYYVDGNLVHTDSFEYGTRIPIRKNEYKLGHTFDGWYNKSEWSALDDKYISGVMGTENVNLYGCFTVNTYKITYFVDGERKTEQSYKFGEIITIPEYNVPVGYTFSGWKLPDGVTTMPAYDVNLYGTTQISFYTLYYKVRTGNGEFETVREIDVHFGGTIPYYDYQSPQGYTFGGWYDAENDGNRVEASHNKKMPASDMTLYGTNTPRTYTVTYYANDKIVNTARVVFGADIPEYTYTIDGQTITRWENLPEKMPARDVVVYSIVTANVYTIDYYIAGEYMYSDKYPYGASVELRPAEFKEGHTFNGWVGETFPEGTMPAKNIRLDGSYSINEYKVIYYVDSLLWKEDTFEFGEKVIAANYTPPLGYSFGGFEGVPSTMPSHDVYVYAVTALNKYELSYYVNNEKVYVISVPYGAEIPEYKYETPTGYQVSAWSALPQIMPAENVNVYATTSAIKYIVSYYVDGVLCDSQEYNYNDSLIVYNYIPHEGKIFLGFEGIPEKMPARDINIYGHTVNKEFHLNYYVDGELVYSDVYEYDAPITLRDEILRYGYVFSGWGNVDRRMPAKDVNVYATMAKNSFDVYYYIDGELVYTDTVVFGEKITPFAPDLKEGFTFGGWTGLPSIMQGENITVEGEYILNKCAVSYYVDGELYKTVVLGYGSNAELFKFETKNYKVTGWMIDGVKVDSLTVDADIRLDAVIEEIEPEFVEKPIFYIIVSSLATVTVGAAIYSTTFLFRRKKGQGI